MIKFSERDYHLAGWILFVLCALLFIVSGIKSRDLLLIAGSVVFLAACIFFIIPLVSKSEVLKKIVRLWKDTQI